MPRPMLAHAHEYLNAALAPGDVAVDATVGNGHDTLFLAEQVGAEGLVIGFDVQAIALVETERRLAEAGYAERVVLLQRGHEAMAEAVPAVLAEQGRAEALIAGACFNLGYLPGSDKTVITRPETTLAALDAALALLAPMGMLTVVLYPGHAGGDTERDAVLAWASRLAPSSHHTQHTRTPNRPGSPELLVVRPF